VLGSSRLAVIVEALARTYDHLLIDAGPVTEAVVERIHALAPRAVLIAADGAAPAAVAARERLAAFGGTAVLDGAASAAGPADAAVPPGRRFATVELGRR